VSGLALATGSYQHAMGEPVASASPLMESQLCERSTCDGWRSMHYNIVSACWSVALMDLGHFTRLDNS